MKKFKVGQIVREISTGDNRTFSKYHRLTVVGFSEMWNEVALKDNKGRYHFMPEWKLGI